MDNLKEIGTTQALINKLQTTVDGGARITLDLSASESEVIKNLMVNKLSGKDLCYVVFLEAEH